MLRGRGKRREKRDVLRAGGCCVSRGAGRCVGSWADVWLGGGGCVHGGVNGMWVGRGMCGWARDVRDGPLGVGPNSVSW